jgi:hypothetical protein
MSETQVKSKGGRPPFQPTPEMRNLVLGLTGLLVPQDTIARLVAGGISVNTLKRYFSTELEIGRDHYVTTLKNRMEVASRAGSVRATSWLLERLGGPEFASRLKVGGMENGPPIVVSAESRVTVYLPDNGRGKKTIDEA